MDKNKVVTIRMDESELDILDRRRGGMGRSEYIRSRIMGDDKSEELLKMTANNTFLLRYLSVALGHKELAMEAKKAADEYVARVG